MVARDGRCPACEMEPRRVRSRDRRPAARPAATQAEAADAEGRRCHEALTTGVGVADLDPMIRVSLERLTVGLRTAGDRPGAPARVPTRIPPEGGTPTRGMAP